MKTITVGLVTLFLLAVVPAMHAQPADSTYGPAAAQQSEQPREQSVTGCLEEGEGGGAYILTTQEGQRIPVTGSADLSKHVGHTVRLIGSVDREGEEASFKVSQVELIAEKCNW